MKIEIKLIPDGLDLAKEIQDGMPIDKMMGMGEEACPVATQDVETNEENKRLAVKEQQYGPAINPEESCGTCSVFNITQHMQQCMKDDSGDLGYCQLLKFMCSASNSCAAWESGGPMSDEPCDCGNPDCGCGM
jgi:hypothetical protein